MLFVSWFECLWEELLCGNSILNAYNHAIQSSLSCITQYNTLSVCGMQASCIYLMQMQPKYVYTNSDVMSNPF